MPGQGAGLSDNGRFLTERLAELARDPVGLRRDLVDAGLVTRTRDGATYWRTHVTEFDQL